MPWTAKDCWSSFAKEQRDADQQGRIAALIERLGNDSFPRVQLDNWIDGELVQISQMLAAGMALSFNIGGAISVDDYLKDAPAEEKKFLSTIPKAQIHLIIVQIVANGQVGSSGILIIRASGSRVRVVGTGEKQTR